MNAHSGEPDHSPRVSRETMSMILRCDDCRVWLAASRWKVVRESTCESSTESSAVTQGMGARHGLYRLVLYISAFYVAQANLRPICNRVMSLLLRTYVPLAAGVDLIPKITVLKLGVF